MRKFQLLGVLVALLSLVVVCDAQSRNLLQNPNADQDGSFWRTFGAAAVETTTSNDKCFVVRNGGYFLQDIKLPDDAVGQYAVLIGRGESERINPDGAITGLPYLYGFMSAGPGPGGEAVLAYLQVDQMLAQPRSQYDWVNMWGIFKVPEQTKSIRFFLKQAARQDVPQNGSAARFDNLGLYLFATKADAESFVAQYH
jgi:hypothetical protein